MLPPLNFCLLNNNIKFFECARQFCFIGFADTFAPFLYPLLDEKTPLIGHENNPNKPMTDERTIRRLVQECFYNAAEQLEKENPEEAQGLYAATVHWLRHTENF